MKNTLNFIQRSMDSKTLYACVQAYKKGYETPEGVAGVTGCKVSEAKLAKRYFNAFNAAYPAFVASNPLSYIVETFKS